MVKSGWLLQGKNHIQCSRISLFWRWDGPSWVDSSVWDCEADRILIESTLESRSENRINPGLFWDYEADHSCVIQVEIQVMTGLVEDLLHLAWRRENRQRVVLFLGKLLPGCGKKPALLEAAKIICEQLCLVSWASSMVDVEFYSCSALLVFYSCGPDGCGNPGWHGFFWVPSELNTIVDDLQYDVCKSFGGCFRGCLNMLRIV